MKDARINTVRDGVVEVGASFGTSEHGPGHDYDQPDGIFLSIEQDSFGRSQDSVVHFDAAGIRRLRKVLKRALAVMDPPAPKPEPDRFQGARIEAYMEGEVRVGAGFGDDDLPLLFVRMEQNSFGLLPPSPSPKSGALIHLTEEQFDALVQAGNRRFGRA